MRFANLTVFTDSPPLRYSAIHALKSPPKLLKAIPSIILTSRLDNIILYYYRESIVLHLKGVSQWMDWIFVGMYVMTD